MPTKKRTISVRLDEATKRRVERAARILKQSSGAFLEKAGEQQARQVLLSWALERHRRGEMSFSELAEETGLVVEEIMLAAGDENPLEALEVFLAGCRSMAEANGDLDFLRLGEDAVRAVKRGRASA
jgi:predicted transcriptional regulator